MKKGSAKRVSSLPSNAEFNLGGLYHALRIATVRSSDSLWVPFDKEGKCCKVIHSPTQPQYVETICCLLYTNDELNTSLRIDPSRASRLVSNTAHVPDYFTNKFLADNIFETFSLNVRDRFLSRFTNEQHEFFRQLLVELVQKIPKNSESAYLASNLPPEYSTDLNANNEKYYTAISRIMFAALRQENMKSDPVPLPAWRNKPKDLLHDDPYGLSVEHSSSTALSIKLVEDKSDGCTKEFFSYERALEFIEKNSAFIMKIDCNLGCITLYYKLDTENYTLCRLEEPDYCREVYLLGYLPVCPKLQDSQYLVLEDAVERSEYTAIVRDKLLRCPMLVVCSRNQDATTNAQIGLAQKYNRIVTTLDGLKKAVSEGDDLVS